MGKTDTHLLFHHTSTAAASEHMNCPECGSKAGNKVYQSVAATVNTGEGLILGIGRTRRCYSCGHKWRTFEASFIDLEPHLKLWYKETCQ